MGNDMRVAIWDGEEEFLSHFRTLMEKVSLEKGYPMTLTEYQNGQQLLDAVRQGQEMDVLFLDRKTQEKDGFETVRQLQKMGCGCPIIFLTSLFSYIQKGGEGEAFRYLLKEQLDDQLEQVLDSCRMEWMDGAFFAFTWEEKSYRVPKADILYFESERRITYLYTKKEVYRLCQRLDDLEDELKKEGFLRCHKSFLVQTRHVRGWKEESLWLDNGKRLPIGRSYMRDVNGSLTEWMGR